MKRRVTIVYPPTTVRTRWDHPPTLATTNGCSNYTPSTSSSSSSSSSSCSSTSCYSSTSASEKHSLLEDALNNNLRGNGHVSSWCGPVHHHHQQHHHNHHQPPETEKCNFNKSGGHSTGSQDSSPCGSRGSPSPCLRKAGGKCDGGHVDDPVDWRVYFFVGLVAIGCYLNGLQGDFVHDDIPAITMNKDVLGLSSVGQVFRNDFWGTPMADVGSHKSYRPLTTLTFR